MRLLALAAVLLALSCNRAASRIEIRPLAEGEWAVVAVTDAGAILQQTHTSRQIPRGQRPELPAFALLDDTLKLIAAHTFSLNAGASPVTLQRIRDPEAYISLHGRPQLVQSPVDPRRFAFEHENAIWLFDAPDSIRKLTRDDDVQTLLGQQREGVAILYWSTHPVWSSDGQLISFLSNREAFRAAGPGQSLWMIDVQAGSQHTLFNEPRVSVHTEGALGDEFVFIGSEPGVFTVHPRTRRVTKRGDGYVAGAHRGGAAVVINNNGRLIMLHGESSDTLPAAPTGRTWNPSVFFSPSGDNVALYSTDNRGDYTLHVWQKNSGTFLSAPIPGGPSYGPVWASESAILFAARRIGGDVITYRADLR